MRFEMKRSWIDHLSPSLTRRVIRIEAVERMKAASCRRTPKYALTQMPMPTDVTSQAMIRVRGARTHNLQGVDVDLPRGRFIVVTGVSGSGKSSLAFDTLFVEGQRRYLASLSASARRMVHGLPRADVDSIDGLPPTLSVAQGGRPVSRRSTLVTLTDVADFLRLLFARAGTAHCPQCGREVTSSPPAEIVQTVLGWGERTRLIVLAPWDASAGAAAALQDIGKAGLVRARVDGEIIDVADATALSGGQRVEAVIDRLILKPGIESRLRESLDLALRHGEGQCVVSVLDGEAVRDERFTTNFRCPHCEITLPPLSPQTFNFNSPRGACPTCGGTGRVDEEETPCPECGGSRLNAVARAVTLAGMALPALESQPLDEAAAWCRSLQDIALTGAAATVRERTVPEIVARLEFLLGLGVSYLTLGRSAETLSGGELQRVRLAGCLGSRLRGVCFVLDEPTAGLHPRDTDRLIESLRRLRDQGSTVIAVEHDVAVMRAADVLVELGPGAGAEGGRLLAQAPPVEVAGRDDVPSASFLRPSAAQVLPPKRSAADAARLVLRGARRHNLRGVTLEVPLGLFVAVTGVSGSGKSTLIMETLLPALRGALSGALAGGPKPCADYDTLEGHESIRRVAEVDQSPLGRSGRSTPATYCGLWDELRNVFARTRDARVRGFTAKRFSFNDRQGRCAACEGRGTQQIDMHLLPDLEITCPACEGRRFNEQTLSVRFGGRSAADVLAMRVDEAAEVFAAFPKPAALLASLRDVGLGYLVLGQSAAQLSGGEAQRVRLATELAGGIDLPRTLYVLDEPTTGLHPADVARLIAVLQRVVDGGHTVVAIAHHLDVVRAADWVIDMGPEGGRGGGAILAACPPLELVNDFDTPTARALASARNSSPVTP
jgi:excinuclease ABC subunit A